MPLKYLILPRALKMKRTTRKKSGKQIRCNRPGWSKEKKTTGSRYYKKKRKLKKWKKNKV